MPQRTARQHSREVFTDSGTIIPTTQGDTGAADAFGRQRTAEPETLFDSSYEYGLQPLFWQMETTDNGSVAHDTDKRLAELSVGAGTGTVTAQTYDYFPYQKGKSQRSLITFVFGTRGNGITRRAGYFDDNDGVFFEQTNGGLFLVLRSSTSGSIVNTRIAQADWNQDPLDGSGASGIALDETRRQILDIDIEWLGVGRVRYGFNIDGMTYYVHYVNNANAGDPEPYMRTGTLPLRYQIENDGSGDAATLLAICNSVFSEGGFDIGRGIPFSASRGAVGAAVAARVPVLSIRPASTFNSIENRVQIKPGNLSVHTVDQTILVEVVYDGLLFGTGSFVGAAVESATEYNASFTTISGGFTVQSFYVSTTGVGNSARGSESSPILSRLPLTLDIDGANPIPLSIVCTPLTGTATVYVSINWSEVK